MTFDIDALLRSRDLCVRSFPAALELRAGGRDGREVEGIAAPYNEPTDLGAYLEVLRPGLFTKSIQERARMVSFRLYHPPADPRNADPFPLPLGPMLELRDTPTELQFRARISATPLGDQALELVRDGALASVSVGFYPIAGKSSRHGDLVERREAALDHVALVRAGAYETAKVLALRHAEHDLELEPATMTLEELRRLTG